MIDSNGLEGRLQGAIDNNGFMNDSERQYKRVQLTTEQTADLAHDIITQRVFGKTRILEYEPWFEEDVTFYTYIIGKENWWSTSSVRNDMEIHHQRTPDSAETYLHIYWNRNTKKHMDEIEKKINDMIEKYLK